MIDRKIKEAFRIARSHYPELKTTIIDLKLKKTDYIMKTLPEALFILKNKKKRKYVIYISKNKNKNAIAQMSSKELIGIFGHELGHIVDYKQKNNLKIIILGCRYLFSKKYLIKKEKDTDIIAIKHGLHRELKQSMVFLLKNQSLSKHTRNRQKNNYLQPKEIDVQVKQLNKK